MNRFYLTIILGAFTTLASAQTNRIYVNPAALGQQNGSSWTDAYIKLRDALAVAEAGDEIWTAHGQYRASETGNRSAYFMLPSGVGLYGGFAGTEMSLDERNIAANPSILDGDIGAPNDSTDNSYNLLYLKNPDGNTVVDGFTFQKAMANQPGATNGLPGASGAAISIVAIDSAAYPVVRNCIFEHNTARFDGGAVHINGKGTGSIAPLFDHCYFRWNRSILGSGGALCREGGSWIDRPEDIRYCTFEFNISTKPGGAVYFSDAQRTDTFDITHSTFRSNQSGGGAGAIVGHSVHISNTKGIGATTVSIRNTIFKEHINYTNYGSGAIGFDSDYFAPGNLILVIDSSYFVNNKMFLIYGEELGATSLFINHSNLEKNDLGITITSLEVSAKSKIENTRIHNCGIMNYGFKITLNTKILDLENISWTDNYGDFSGFSIYAPYNNNISHYNISVNAKNIIIAGNKTSSQNNAGIYISASSVVNSATFSANNVTAFNNYLRINNNINTSFKNSIFKIDSISQVQQSTPIQSFTYDHCIFSLPDTFSNLGWMQSNNQWSTDPMFVAPDSGDFRLSACSPAINAGTNNGIMAQKDIFGNPRIQFGTVDIGAIEAGVPVFYTPPVIEASCSGGSGGTADLSGLDICSPAQYQWSNGPVSDQPKQTDLEPGVYTITVTDTKGRSLSLSIEIPEAPSLALQAVSLPVVCGDTLGGSAAVQIAGNPGPFVYDWGFSADSLVQHLSAGVYSVTVTDAHQCSATTSVEVKRAGSLQLTFEFDPISCFGANDASLSVIPANGKSPFTWLWNDGFEGPTRAPVGSGAYGGNLTDAFGCNTQWYVPVSEPAPLHLTGFVNPATGPQTPDGIILLDSLTGGKSPYSITWNTGQSGLNLMGLLPGNYTATMTDQNGCTLVKTFTVSFESGTAAPLNNAGAYQIYPNPSPGALFLAGPGFGEMQFTLKDDTGKTVFKQTFEAGKGAMFNRTFEPVALPAGAYHWSLVCGSGHFGGIWVKGR